MGAVCCPCRCNDVAPASDPYRPTEQKRIFRTASIDPYQNINVSTKNPLRLIDGYLNEPLLELPEALKPVADQIPDLSKHISQALQKCKYPSSNKLTRDESAAIYLYTMRWGPPSLADQLHAAWNSENRSQLKPWFRYLRLLKSAYDKLPNAPSTVYQGAANRNDLLQKFDTDGSPLYCSFAACFGSSAELRHHLHRRGIANPSVVSYEAFDGKSIAEYAVNGANVVLLFPGVKAGNVALEEHFADGSVVLHLTTKNKQPLLSPQATPRTIEWHFVCANKICKHRCRGGHRNSRCCGYSLIKHACEHHCGPVHQCFSCGEHMADLHECNQCQSRYCERCCFKPTTLEALFFASEAYKNFSFKTG